MANSILHAGLPFPVYGALYSTGFPYLDADGDPTDPTTPDTEISLDGAAYGDCTNEVAVVTVGTAWITFTAAEMTSDLAMVQLKAASGPKTTVAILQPRRLPVFAAETATAGAAGTITLAVGSSALDNYYLGMIVRINSGTGAGQARLVKSYVGSTRVLTVEPNWETTPANDSVYDILLTELSVNKLMTATAISDGAIVAATLGADAITNAKIADDAIAAENLATGAISADAFAADAIVAATLNTGCLTADAFAANALVAATFAADCITNAKIADDAIAAENLKTGALTADAFAADALVAATFNTGCFTADAFAADAIVAATLATGVLTADAFAANAIIAATLAADCITAAKVADGTIDAATFATAAITASAIASDAIGAAEVAAGAASEIGAQSSDTRLKWRSTQPT